MNHAAVIYSSKSGTIKYYAKKISKALQTDLLDVMQLDNIELLAYQTIIYGTRQHAFSEYRFKGYGGKWNRPASSNRIVFIIGLLDPSDEKNIQRIRQGLERILSQEMMENVAFFDLKGKVDFQNLHNMHKSMRNMMKGCLSRREVYSQREEDRGMLQIDGHKMNCIHWSPLTMIIHQAKHLKSQLLQ